MEDIPAPEGNTQFTEKGPELPPLTPEGKELTEASPEAKAPKPVESSVAESREPSSAVKEEAETTGSEVARQLFAQNTPKVVEQVPGKLQASTRKVPPLTHAALWWTVVRQREREARRAA